MPIVHCLKFYEFKNLSISEPDRSWTDVLVNMNALCIGKQELTRFPMMIRSLPIKKNEIPKTAMTQCHNCKGSGGAGQLLTKSWQKLPGDWDLTNAPPRKSGHVTRIHGL